MSNIAATDQSAVSELQSEHPLRKKRGRKQIRRDVMAIYFDIPYSAMAIPYGVFETMNRPSLIELKYVENEARLLVCVAETAGNSTVAVPSACYESRWGLYFEMPELTGRIQEALEWDSDIYEAQCRFVYNLMHEKLVLCDLNTAIVCGYIPEECIYDGETIIQRKGWRSITKKDFRSHR